MKLVSFSVNNYRSITKANSLPLFSSTILIGPNNEGKSNILNALNASMALLEIHSKSEKMPEASLIRRYRKVYLWDEDYPIQLQEDRPNGRSVFTLEFELTSQEISEFKREIGSNLNGTLPVEIRIGQKGIPSFKVKKKGPVSNYFQIKSLMWQLLLGKGLNLIIFQLLE